MEPSGEGLPTREPLVQRDVVETQVNYTPLGQEKLNKLRSQWSPGLGGRFLIVSRGAEALDPSQSVNLPPDEAIPNYKVLSDTSYAERRAQNKTLAVWETEMRDWITNSNNPFFLKLIGIELKQGEKLAEDQVNQAFDQIKSFFTEDFGQVKIDVFLNKIKEKYSTLDALKQDFSSFATFCHIFGEHAGTAVAHLVGAELGITDEAVKQQIGEKINNLGEDEKALLEVIDQLRKEYERLEKEEKITAIPPGEGEGEKKREQPVGDNAQTKAEEKGIEGNGEGEVTKPAEVEILSGGVGHSEQQIEGDDHSVGGDYWLTYADIQPPEEIVQQRGQAYLVMDTATIGGETEQTKRFAQAFLTHYYNQTEQFSDPQTHAQTAFNKAKNEIGLIDATFTYVIKKEGKAYSGGVGNSPAVLVRKSGQAEYLVDPTGQARSGFRDKETDTVYYLDEITDEQKKQFESNPDRYKGISDTKLIASEGPLRQKELELGSDDYVVLHTDGIKPEDYNVEGLKRLVEQLKGVTTEKDDSIVLIAR